MNRTIWMAASLTTLTTLMATSAAQAQSSVTLYGRLDTGIEYMSGVPANSGSASRWRAENGDWSASMWGLKGVEDLGGGLRTLFQLEGALNVTNGAGAGDGQLFNRLAFVGLGSDRYGTLLLGRQFFIANGVWDFDPFGQSAWSSGSLVRGRNWPSSSNTISYQTPKYAGFDFYGQYALSNATNWNGNGTTAQGREAGAQLTYTSALFQARAIYDEIRDPANGQFDDPFTASREYTAALNVFLGPFKIQGAYQAIRTSGGSATAGVAPTTLDHEWGGVTWRISPAAALIAAVYHVNANKGGGNATIYTLGGSYNLSTRTLLDFQAASVRNSSGANFSLNANAAGTGAASGNPIAGASQTGVYAGIQHLF